MAEKRVMHSMEEIEQFVADGGKVTKLEIQVDNVSPDQDPLDMTLRQFAVMTAGSNAAVNTLTGTLGDAEEPEVTLLVGITPLVVRAVRRFSDELMVALDSGPYFPDDRPLCPHCGKFNDFPIGRMYDNKWSTVRCRECKTPFQVFARVRVDYMSRFASDEQ